MSFVSCFDCGGLNIRQRCVSVVSCFDYGGLNFIRGVYQSFPILTMVA